jgi:hypothetical protein
MFLHKPLHFVTFFQTLFHPYFVAAITLSVANAIKLFTAVSYAYS